MDTIIDEVNWVRRNWPLQYVVFIDDLFIIYDDWLEEFAEKWSPQVGLPFFCNVRANLIVRGPHKVDLLNKAGCATVSMGIEAANDRIRYELLKRRMTREDIVQAGSLVRDAGIQITATNILGLPTSTLQDDLETMRLNAAARITYAHAFLFQPYPGAELGQFTQRGGYMEGTFDPAAYQASPQPPLGCHPVVGAQTAQGVCDHPEGASDQDEPGRLVEHGADVSGDTVVGVQAAHRRSGGRKTLEGKGNLCALL